MSKLLACECGVVIRGATDDELVERTQRHALEVHRMQLTREQVLAMARPA